jgi:hypothetical protein
MLRLALPVLLQGHDKLLLQAFLRGPTTKTIKSLLTGTVTTQSPLTGTGAIQSPLVGTGTFHSNSPVGIDSVHDIHTSNIDLNAQAQTEMLSNPFMWMFNMPNQQDFWKDFIDKRVQEAFNPTLLRSAATFISNTTTSVSTSVACTTNLGSKKSNFHFKNRELFVQNIELKKIDSQFRLLLRQISHGVLLTSYIAKVNIDDDRLDALEALLQVSKAMSDVTARIAVNSVKCRRVLHIKDLTFICIGHGCT